MLELSPTSDGCLWVLGSSALHAGSHRPVQLRDAIRVSTVAPSDNRPPAQRPQLPRRVKALLAAEVRTVHNGNTIAMSAPRRKAVITALGASRATAASNQDEPKRRVDNHIK